MAHHPRTRHWLIAILAACIGAVSAQAQSTNGTWTGLGTEWTMGTNWSSTPTVPDDTATFTNNGAPTSVTISTSISINTIEFTAAAPAYAFATSGLNILGAGIVNNSSHAGLLNALN